MTKTLLMSMTTTDGKEYGWDCRLPNDLAEKLTAASEAGLKPRIDGVADSRYPEWVVGTPLMPIWGFFSRIWHS